MSETNGTVIRWSRSLHAWVRVVQHRQLMGRELVEAVVEGSDQLQTLDAADLAQHRPVEPEQALAVTAAARIWAAMGADVLLSPLISRVIPLPHQFHAVRRALSSHPMRLLFADEVGLGKTIEAGLVIKELKLRGRIDRVLVLAPKSLLLQWVSEMETLFDEPFELVVPGEWSGAFSWESKNLWRQCDQVVTSYDSVKPRESQRGWDRERLERYNVQRFHDLINAGWDLVIMDEAHRMAGASDDVARYELARAIVKAVPHLLLLTATPHSGKSDAFRRLLSLLDNAAFTEGAPIIRQTVAPYVVRTEKRTAVDAAGKPLFAPRRTQLIVVPYGPEHALQQHLYDAVSEYVCTGYQEAEAQGDSFARLLLMMTQRLVSSSTRAVRHFVERRLEVLASKEEELKAAAYDPDEPDETPEASALCYVPVHAHEIARLESLRDLCLRVEASGPDARAAALLGQIRRICQEFNEPSKKFLVFTEFRQTQQMLAEYLFARGYPVVTLNGEMSLQERREAQKAFQDDAQVLIMTDAGAEGLNLQFAHVVINYDLPWAPMRVEQRIGRVDRIGQQRPVIALNLVLRNSVEARIYELWQEKLARIREEFGVDKAADVLDSTEVDAQFTKLAETALLRPDTFDQVADQIITELRRGAAETTSLRDLVETTQPTTQEEQTVPLEAWLHTVAQAGAVSEPESRSAGDALMDAVNRVRPYWALGQPALHLDIRDLGYPVEGWFSVWRVGVAQGAWRQQKLFALFTTDAGQSLERTAQGLWDALAAGAVNWRCLGEAAPVPYETVLHDAERIAKGYYQNVLTQMNQRNRMRREALDLSYLQRKSALREVGLEAVRQARMRELEQEYRRRVAELEQAENPLPDLCCMVMLRIEAR